MRDSSQFTSPTTGWSEFEQELDRLKSELDAIRQEAALRFAHCSAQRYGNILKIDLSKPSRRVESPTRKA